jgi:hypothetical protein
MDMASTAIRMAGDFTDLDLADRVIRSSAAMDSVTDLAADSDTGTAGTDCLALAPET